MNFHYHPILGLQWSCGYCIIEVDIDAMPDVPIKEAVKLWEQLGVMLVDDPDWASCSRIMPSEKITSNT